MIMKLLPMHEKKLKSGVVLPFVLIIMVLMFLVGATLLLRSRNELNTSGEINMSRNAFLTTDAHDQIALMLTRILMYPELGTPETIAVNTSGTEPYSIVVNVADSSHFSLTKFIHEYNTGKVYDSKLRYIRAASQVGRTDPAFIDPVTLSAINLSPHLVFKVKDAASNETIIGASAVSIDLIEAASAGSSLGGGDAYDSANGNPTKIMMSISTIGRPINSSDQFDPSAFDGVETTSPRSVISSILMEIK